MPAEKKSVLFPVVAVLFVLFAVGSLIAWKMDAFAEKGLKQSDFFAAWGMPEADIVKRFGPPETDSRKVTPEPGKPATRLAGGAEYEFVYADNKGSRWHIEFTKGSASRIYEVAK